MTSDIQLYRLPEAQFPLRFELQGDAWELRTYYVQSGWHWRCYLEGQKRWNVTSGNDEASLLKELRETGIVVHRTTFVGTAFRHLETLCIAERLA